MPRISIMFYKVYIQGMFGKLYFCETEIDFYLNSRSNSEINSVCSNEWTFDFCINMSLAHGH